MRRATTNTGIETLSFGPENKLRIFPPNSYKFKPKDHIVLDEAQECILDNFWYQYNNKKEEKGYFLSILNSLAEYFNDMNTMMPIQENIEAPEQRPLYVIFEGKNPGIYVTYEKLVAQKVEARYTGGISFKKYINIDEALAQARRILGINYYIEPEAKEYMQLFRRASKKNIQAPIQTINIKEEGMSSKKTYKECLIRGVDPLDSEYIDIKLQERYDQILPEWKKELKQEILTELKVEMTECFEKMKKEYESKYDIDQFLNDDSMDIVEKEDIRGHGQSME